MGIMCAAGLGLSMPASPLYIYPYSGYRYQDPQMAQQNFHFHQKCLPDGDGTKHSHLSRLLHTYLYIQRT